MKYLVEVTTQVEVEVDDEDDAIDVARELIASYASHDFDYDVIGIVEQQKMEEKL